MLIIPAIDLKDGKCVRLKQGRMEDDTVFSDDPVATAQHWVNEGARRLHLVDLNGAFAGTPIHKPVVEAIAREKNVEHDVVYMAVEMALASATKKQYEGEVDIVSIATTI